MFCANTAQTKSPSLALSASRTAKLELHANSDDWTQTTLATFHDALLLHTHTYMYTLAHEHTKASPCVQRSREEAG